MREELTWFGPPDSILSTCQFIILIEIHQRLITATYIRARCGGFNTICPIKLNLVYAKMVWWLNWNRLCPQFRFTFAVIGRLRYQNIRTVLLQYVSYVKYNSFESVLEAFQNCTWSMKNPFEGKGRVKKKKTQKTQFHANICNKQL